MKELNRFRCDMVKCLLLKDKYGGSMDVKLDYTRSET